MRRLLLTTALCATLLLAARRADAAAGCCVCAGASCSPNPQCTDSVSSDGQCDIHCIAQGPTCLEVAFHAGGTCLAGCGGDISTPTTTPTLTQTPMATGPTRTPTNSPTLTLTSTITPTKTNTIVTPTWTPTITRTPRPAKTSTPTPANTATITQTPTATTFVTTTAAPTLVPATATVVPGGEKPYLGDPCASKATKLSVAVAITSGSATTKVINPDVNLRIYVCGYDISSTGTSWTWKDGTGTDCAFDATAISGAQVGSKTVAAAGTVFYTRPARTLCITTSSATAAGTISYVVSPPGLAKGESVVTPTVTDTPTQTPTVTPT